MFDKLRKAFSSAAKSIGQKEISSKILEDTLLDLQIALLESDVAQEVVDSLSDKLKKDLLGLKLEKGQQAEDLIQSRFKQAVAEIFARAGHIDMIEKIMAKKNAKGGPYSIVFLGINGTGKTTTVAKVANMLRKSGLSVVVAAGDTHRAGAIEQLSQHCERLSIKVIAQRYGADPSAVGRDAQEYARKHYVDVVLVDTAGRMQTSKNLMDEMSKIVRVVKPDAKLFIGDSLAGNDTINQAREFFQYTNFDGAILTKVDADAKGGSAISIAHITSKPICYIGIGQGYEDIIRFDPDKFIETLFGTGADVTVESLISRPPTETIVSEDVVNQPDSKEEMKAHQLTEPIEKNSGFVVAEANIQNNSRPATPVSSPLGVMTSRQSIETRLSRTPEPPVAPPAANRPVTSAPEKPPEPIVKHFEQVKVQESVSTGPDLKSKISQEDKPAKKGRFGFFGRKTKTDDGESKGVKSADQIPPQEEKKGIPLIKGEKRKEDKDNDRHKDEVIYLSDEDIEDLLNKGKDD